MLRLLSLFSVALACASLLSTAALAANNSGTANTRGSAVQPQLSPHDELFLSLRDAASRNQTDLVDKLSAQLPSQYPLHSFAEYWKLKVRLPAVSDAQMQQFIKRYDGQFVADRLRNDWLLILARRGDWKLFDEQLPLFGFADDPQVDCYALLSKAVQGVSVKAEARFLAMRNPTSLAGEGCLALTEALYKTQQFQAADVWDAIHVLAEGKRGRAAVQLAMVLKSNHASVIENIISTPSTALQQAQSSADRPLHQLALAALARGGYWGKEKVTAHAAVQGAAACALRLGNDCNSWFKPGGHAVPLPASLEGLGSDNALEWSMRAAMRAQDWALLSQLAQRLPPHLKQDATWTYWHAKALSHLGQPEQARAMFESIATGYGFYNLLAREAIGQALTALPAHTLKLDDGLVKAIMGKDEVLRMQTFFKLGLRWEGNREWNWLIRGNNEHGQNDAHLLHHAEAAKRLGYLDRMINSAERSKTQIDFKHRFPRPYFTQVQPIADGLALDTNWVYGLMRQESRFISDIRSSVSARGLMQIMPATAAYVAKKVNYPNYSLERLIEPEINLTLGHHYLAMVQADLDNLPILATAAYNAGPSRPKAWRASLYHSVEGAVFAETIPFNETRGYVKNVFANAVLYALVNDVKPDAKPEGKPEGKVDNKLENKVEPKPTANKPRLLSQWLGVVLPKTATVTSLP